MSQVMVSRNTLAYRRRRSKSSIFEIKSFMVVVTMCVTISFLSIMLLVHFNKVATKGYTIKYLEVQQQQLWEENEILKKELLEKKALTDMRITEKAASMGSPKHVSYVTGHTALAQNAP